MKRPIKFRVWDVQEKQMFDPSEIPNNSIGCIPEDDDEQIFVHMQYIGVQDKNNIEIYEGDIIIFKDENKKGVIMWQPQGACFYITYVVGEKTFYAEIRDQAMHGDEEVLRLTNAEIIGNIYENPEILKPAP